MPKRRQYKDYTIIEGGDDLSYGYGFCIKIRRDIPDEEIEPRALFLEQELAWLDCYGHDFCNVYPRVPLKRANEIMIETVADSEDTETTIIDWSSVVPLEDMEARIVHKEDTDLAWDGPKGNPVFHNVMELIRQPFDL